MSQPAASGPIIIAENDDLVRGILRSVLSQTGHEVLLARDGLQAVALSQQRKPILVLLDIAMPRLSGMLACEALRAHDGYGDVPIVMLTGYSDDRMRQSARRLGATDFITKPFQPCALLMQLACYLDGDTEAATQAARRLPSQTQAITSAARDPGDRAAGTAHAEPDALRGGWVPTDDCDAYGSPAALENAYLAAGIPLGLVQKWMGYAPISLSAIAPIAPSLADLARTPRPVAMVP